MLLENTIKDYKEKCEIKIANVDAIQILVESLNDENESNQEKHKSEIKRMKYKYNIKDNHAKCERELNIRRIKSLETRNIELQDIVDNKSIAIANLQKQINKTDEALKEKTK